jgi:hypothetical protein
MPPVRKPKSAVSAWIVEQRNRQDPAWKSEELARRLGVAESTVRGWESGRTISRCEPGRARAAVRRRGARAGERSAGRRRRRRGDPRSDRRSCASWSTSSARRGSSASNCRAFPTQSACSSCESKRWELEIQRWTLTCEERHPAGCQAPHPTLEPQGADPQNRIVLVVRDAEPGPERLVHRVLRRVVVGERLPRRHAGRIEPADLDQRRVGVAADMLSAFEHPHRSFHGSPRGDGDAGPEEPARMNARAGRAEGRMIPDRLAGRGAISGDTAGFPAANDTPRSNPGAYICVARDGAAVGGGRDPESAPRSEHDAARARRAARDVARQRVTLGDRPRDAWSRSTRSSVRRTGGPLRLLRPSAGGSRVTERVIVTQRAASPAAYPRDRQPHLRESEVVHA